MRNTRREYSKSRRRIVLRTNAEGDVYAAVSSDGVEVETTVIVEAFGDYDGKTVGEYISDQQWMAYRHWEYLYRNGHVDLKTALQIIKADNLERFYVPTDFPPRKGEQPTAEAIAIAKENELNQKRYDAALDNFAKVHSIDRKLLAAGA